jgi:diguanylate cyclase (GGDEF)-like protein
VVDPPPHQRLRTHLQRLPPEALSLGLLYVGGFACLALAVAFPMSEDAPVRLGAVLAVLALAIGIATLTVGARLKRRVLLGGAVLASLLNSLLVAYASTKAGVMGDAIAYFWLQVWVSIFFPRAAYAFAALVAVGFGAGVLATGLSAMLAPWAVVAIPVWALGAILARVSRIVSHRVNTDGLTGALNRDGLRAAAHRELRRARRDRQQLAVVALDLDDFKRVNDEEGHAAGDDLLSETVAAWRVALRTQDIVARTGGDEFVLLLPDTSAEEAEAVLERLREAHPVRWSAGIAELQQMESLQSSLELADQRLYAEKASRREP